MRVVLLGAIRLRWLSTADPVRHPPKSAMDRQGSALGHVSALPFRLVRLTRPGWDVPAADAVGEKNEHTICFLFRDFADGARGGLPGAEQGPPDAYGHPDFQGFWANNSATPLERPRELADHPVLTDAEVAAMKKKAIETYQSGKVDAGSAIAFFGLYGTTFTGRRATKNSISLNPPPVITVRSGTTCGYGITGLH